MVAHSFRVPTLLCSFSKFLRYFYKKFFYINTSISKILMAGLNVLPFGLYFCDFALSAPPSPIMNLWILFDIYATSVNSLCPTS